jgi:hypothetical protein
MQRFPEPIKTTLLLRALHLEPVELVINNKELPKRPPEFKK